MKRKLWSKLIYFNIILYLLVSLATFGSAQGASTTTQPSGPRYGGIFRFVDRGDGISIGYPPKIVANPTFTIRALAPAIETLLRVDKAGVPSPWLATGFKSDVASKALILTLRKGAKFHDGTDFNAEAAKWNLDQSVSARQQGTERIRSIDVIDDYTIRINLKDWDNTVITNLTLFVGMMISPTAYKKNGEEWCSNHPVGTGPFQFVSWQKDVRTIYKKFDGYWQKGKPYLDGVEFTPILDPLTRLISFRKENIDLTLSIEPKDLAGLEKEGYVVTRRKLCAAYNLIPDSANPKSPFADTRVRQAMSYAIDTEAIVKTLYYGEYEASNQPIYKGYWGYSPSVVGYPYNPAKAKQLLAEAGYPNGFKTKLLYVTRGADLDQVYIAAQGYLRAVGIDVELDPAQTGRYQQIAFQGGSWEGITYGIISHIDLTAAVAERFIGGGPYYTKMLVPNDYVKAVQNAKTAPDFETKQKWTQEAMKLMIDKYCLLTPLYVGTDFAVSKTYLHDHGFLGVPDHQWWTPADTWLEK